MEKLNGSAGCSRLMEQNSAKPTSSKVSEQLESDHFRNGTVTANELIQ